MRIWLIRICCVLAAALSGWLLYTSLFNTPLPGCSADGGCGDVLSSRWAYVLGVPVSLFAVVAYAVLLAGSLHHDKKQGQLAMSLVAAAVLVSAVWFVGLQIYLGSFCVYCLTAHAFGAAAGLLVLLKKHRPIVWLGVLPVLVMVGLQVALPPPPKPIASKQFGGFVNLDPHQYPTLGDPEAGVAIAYLYDANCKKCRSMHADIQAALDRYGRDKLVVAMMPTPFSGECNQHMDVTLPGFESSCEVARLSLAVWLADPAKFEPFDAKLFAGPDDQAISLSAVKQIAEQTIDSDELAEALADPRIDQALKNNSELFSLLEFGLPRLIVAGQAYPPLATREDLFRLLELTTDLESP